MVSIGWLVYALILGGFGGNIGIRAHGHGTKK